ncbi:MAG TPA: hypothetical protein VFF91_02905 [Pseudoxanthomonas sp.]|nr:hypothetical protein [Pseudoxanthomonas sp.]
MSRHRILHPLSVALLAALALAACKRDNTDTAATPATDPAPPAPMTAPTAPATPDTAPAATTAAASVASVELGTAVGADNRVTAASTAFSPRDTIYASVTTRTSDPAASVPGRLTARWTYQDGQTVHEESRDLTLAGDGTTSFQISKPDGLPAGRYKVEIALDGTVVQSRDFEVR